MKWLTVILCRAGAVGMGVLVAFLMFAVCASASVIIWVPGTHAEGVPQSYPSAAFPAAVQVDAMAPDATKKVVEYPGTIRPVSGFNSPTLGESVSVGVPNLKALVRESDGTVVVFSLSQGGIVSSLAKYELGMEPNAPPSDKLVFVTLGNPMRQGSGLLAVMKPFGGIPLLDIPFYGETVDNQYKSIDVVRQYDAVGHFPKYWYVNWWATANSFAGFAFYHPDYTSVSIDPEDPRNFSYQLGNTTYIMQREKLPLLIPVRMVFEPFGFKPLIDALEVVLKPIVDAGYGPALPPGAVPIPPSATKMVSVQATEEQQVTAVQGVDPSVEQVASGQPADTVASGGPDDENRSGSTPSMNDTVSTELTTEKEPVVAPQSPTEQQGDDQVDEALSSTPDDASSDTDPHDGSVMSGGNKVVPGNGNAPSGSDSTDGEDDNESNAPDISTASPEASEGAKSGAPSAASSSSTSSDDSADSDDS